MPVTLNLTDNEAKLVRDALEHAGCRSNEWDWDAVGKAIGRNTKTSKDDFNRVLKKIKEAVGIPVNPPRRAPKRKREDSPVAPAASRASTEESYDVIPPRDPKAPKKAKKTKGEAKAKAKAKAKGKGKAKA